MLNPRMLLISAPELSVGAVGLCCLLNVSITHFDSHIHSPIYIYFIFLSLLIFIVSLSPHGTVKRTSHHATILPTESANSLFGYAYSMSFKQQFSCIY